MAMKRFVLVILLILITGLALWGETGTPEVREPAGLPYWSWVVLLFLFSFCLGIVAVLAGVGGGVLFVPLVGSFFPFHLDFVRGAGLLVALTGALSASPGLLKNGMANMKLAMPMALIGSACSLFGALVGLSLPASTVEIFMGIAVISIVLLMLRARRSEFPGVESPDRLSRILGIYGIYYEDSLGKEIPWGIHRTAAGLVLFTAIGFMGGMFGMGAGWANVPVFNLLLGAPLKVSVATSLFFISINSSAAAWIYLIKGAVLPMIAVPSMAGMVLGTRLGVRLLSKARPALLRWIVLIILSFAGIKMLLRGTGVWI